MKREQGPKTVVLIAINDFLIGGAQRLIVDLLQEWDADSYEFHLLTFREFPDKENFFGQLPDTIKTHHIPVRRILDIVGLFRVRKLIARLSPSVILSNLYLSNSIIRLSLLGIETPVITVEHNTYTNKNVFQHIVDWILSFRSSKIIAVSEGVARFLVSVQHISRKRITVIVNGIDLVGIRSRIAKDSRLQIRESLGIPANEIIVLHVGRLVRQKDPLLMLRAYASFARNATHTSKLFIVGDGDMRQDLEDEAERLGVQHHVIFTGERSPHMFYMASDVFLSTSVIEGFGLARAEALAYGIPVVTTGTGGTDELIKNQHNGIVVPSRDSEQLSQGLARALSIPRDIVHTAAKETVERFSIAVTATAYERLIKDVLHLP